MSRIEKAFANGKAFIPFLTCGDPDLETTKKLIVACADAGADLIELGIPFSDPTAEGPVIMAANARALAGGVTTDRVFDMVEEVRREVSLPMVFMTYANVLFGYGTERFLARAAKAGMDGVILPDVPYEEKEEFVPLCRKYGIAFISMIAPTSDARAEMIAQEAEGFLYCVSSMGVTGERAAITGEIGNLIASVRKVSPVPAAIGFGISTPSQAHDMAALSDGAIVGSAIVRLIGEYGKEAVPHVAAYVREMKAAL